MRATLQLETLKNLLKVQYGVPDGITEQLEYINRLTYKEGYNDAKADLRESKDSQREGEGL